MAATVRILLCLLGLLLIGPASASATHWQDDEGYEQFDPEPYPVTAPPVATPGPVPPVVTPGPVPPSAPPVATPEPEIPLVTTPTVAGKVAMLRVDGKAAIPRGAPKRVRAIIAAANQIVGKPYKWGGGHARLVDRGYDCSGTVSYALIKSGTGLLASPLVSGSFARWGAAGDGNWVSVYANEGHVYMEVAGLRLDTSALADPLGGKGPRWRPAIGRRKGFKARHPLGL